MIDNIVIDLVIKIITIIITAIWTKMQSMNYILKDFFLTKLKAIYTAKIVVEKSKKRKREDSIAIFMILITIIIWKIAEQFVVINPVMVSNHHQFLVNFQIKILIKDKIIFKIHRNNFKYCQ